MIPWLQKRMDILRLTLHRPILLSVFALLQAVKILLSFAPLGKITAPLAAIFNLAPWYGWVAGWLLLFGILSVEYSVERKETFDKTSLNFFKAFLDFLIHQGNALFDNSAEKNFYTKINDWQRQVIEGIAIGLGHEASEKYFQKMDSQHSVTRAYKESQSSGSNEPLCLWLQENLKELEAMRMTLAETKDLEPGGPGTPKKMNLLGEFKP